MLKDSFDQWFIVPAVGPFSNSNQRDSSLTSSSSSLRVLTSVLEQGRTTAAVSWWRSRPTFWRNSSPWCHFWPTPDVHQAHWLCLQAVLFPAPLYWSHQEVPGRGFNQDTRPCVGAVPIGLLQFAFFRPAHEADSTPSSCSECCCSFDLPQEKIRWSDKPSEETPLAPSFPAYHVQVTSYHLSLHTWPCPFLSFSSYHVICAYPFFEVSKPRSYCCSTSCSSCSLRWQSFLPSRS